MSVYKTAMWMTIAILGSKLIGFFREIIFAYYFGATYISDAYFMAVAIPSIIIGGVFSTAATSYMPIYSDVYAREGKDSANQLTNKVVNILLVVSTAIAIFGIVFSKEIVSLLARGFDGNTLSLTVDFVKVSFFAMTFGSITGIFSSFLQYHNRFVLQTIISYSFNAVLLLTIIISGIFSFYYLIWGLLLAQLVQLLLMARGARQNGYLYTFSIHFKDKNIIKLILISFPIFISSFAVQINAFVDKMLASGLPEGSIAALNYGNLINTVVYGSLTMALTTIIYPMFSKQVAAADIEGMKRSVIKALSFAIIVLVPVSVGLIILRIPIIQIIYERGVFDETATQMTSVTLFYFSMGMLGVGIRDIVERAFFSVSDTQTPMINGIICVAINIILNVLLIDKMGIAGLALSTSIASISAAILMFHSFCYRYKSKEYQYIALILVKTFIAATTMGVCIYYLNGLLLTLSTGIVASIVSLVLTIVVGAIVYYIILMLVKVEEIKLLNKIFSRKQD